MPSINTAGPTWRGHSRSGAAQDHDTQAPRHPQCLKELWPWPCSRDVARKFGGVIFRCSHESISPGVLAVTGRQEVQWTAWYPGEYTAPSATAAGTRNTFQ